MKQLYKECYTAPLAEALVVKMERNLLEGSVGVVSTREGAYGEAIVVEGE